MNKNLDRNTEFENDKDVLLNPDIINIDSINMHNNAKLINI